jgi:hypothetical protein
MRLCQTVLNTSHFLSTRLLWARVTTRDGNRGWSCGEALLETKLCKILNSYTMSVTDSFFDGRMPSSGIWRRVALVRTGILEKILPPSSGWTRIGELKTTSTVTSNRGTQRRNTHPRRRHSSQLPPWQTLILNVLQLFRHTSAASAV